MPWNLARWRHGILPRWRHRPKLLRAEIHRHRWPFLQRLLSEKLCVRVRFVDEIPALVIYKNFVFPHTVANKVTGVLLFVGVPLTVFLESFVPLVIIAVVATFVAVQEGHFSCAKELPEGQVAHYPRRRARHPSTLWCERIQRHGLLPNPTKQRFFDAQVASLGVLSLELDAQQI